MTRSHIFTFDWPYSSGIIHIIVPGVVFRSGYRLLLPMRPSAVLADSTNTSDQRTPVLADSTSISKQRTARLCCILPRRSPKPNPNPTQSPSSITPNPTQSPSKTACSRQRQPCHATEESEGFIEHGFSSVSIMKYRVLAGL